MVNLCDITPDGKMLFDNIGEQEAVSDLRVQSSLVVRKIGRIRPSVRWNGDANSLFRTQSLRLSPLPFWG